MTATRLHHTSTRGPTVGDATPARALHHSSVVTPEAVLLEFRAAGVGSRILAKVLDLMLQGLIFSIAAVPIALLGAPTLTAILMTLLGFVVLFGYPASEAFMSGQTVGKKMLGIRVVTTEGGPVQFRHAAVRAIVGVVEFALIPGGALAMIVSLVSKRSQRVGDMAAGTIVVRIERAMPQPVFFPVVQGYEAFSERFDAGGMTKDQFSVLRDYMVRYRQLTPAAASQLAALMSDQLQRSGATPRLQHMSHEHYLMAAVFAYQRRFTFEDGSSEAPVLPRSTGGYGTGYTTAAPPPPGSGRVPRPVQPGATDEWPTAPPSAPI